MKKNYEKPQMEVVRMEQGLLAGSGARSIDSNVGFSLGGGGNGSGDSSPRASEFFDDGSEGW